MNNIEKELENMEVPDELEEVLRSGLKDANLKKKRFNLKGKVAALLVATLLIGSNVDTLAYYGKKLIGYDEIMNGTLKELNDLEKGQIIDKSYSFKDESKVTLDGVMLDDNNMVIFYTIYDPNANASDLFSGLPSLEAKGFRRTFTGGGQGETSDDGKKMKWVMRYDAPNFYEKNISFIFTNESTGEEGKIEFELDKNKAMGKKIKLNINENVQLSNREIKLESLVASPMSTVVKGQFRTILQMGLDKVRGEEINFELIELDLLADGKVVRTISSSNSTSLRGGRFDFTFERIPDNTKEVVLKLRNFGTSETVNQKIKLEKGKIDKSIGLLDNSINIDINEIYEKEGKTYINITTEENVYLNSFHLSMDGKKVNQERTIESEGEYADKTEGQKPIFYRTRTIEFVGTGEDLELVIEKIRYTKDYDKIIYTHTIK